jgi:hypothetical protein
MFNKELEAGMLALNVRMDNIQKLLQDIYDRLPEKIPQPDDSPFLTKEGLYNYKHRKPKPEE